MSDTPVQFLLDRVASGKVLGEGAGPPCETFSHARSVQPGPRPLRSFAEPYGLAKADLYPEEWEQLRIDNLLAFAMRRLAKPSMRSEAPPHENPREWD